MIEAGSIVRVSGGREGVVAWNPWEDVIPNEVPIVTGVALQADLLVTSDAVEVVGKYEPQINSPKDCGLGTPNPCNYIGLGSDGAKCLRFTEASIMLMSRAQDRGQLLPVSLFPACQDEIQVIAEGTLSEEILKANEVTHRTPRAQTIGSITLNDVEYTLLKLKTTPKEAFINAAATALALSAIAAGVIETFRKKKAA